MFRKYILGLQALLLLIGVGSASPSLALNAQHLRPGTGGTKGFQLYTSDSLKQGQFSLGVVANYAQHLVTRRPLNGGQDQQILDEALMVDYLIDFAIFDWWNINIDIPMTAYHNVQTTPVSVRDEGGGALGDVSARMKFQIFDAEQTSKGLGLALIAQMNIPTGQDSIFIGDSGLTTSFIAAGDWQIHRNRFYLNAGYRLRERENIGNGELIADEELLFGGGWQRLLKESWRFHSIIEGYGFVTLADNPRGEHRVPFEMLFIGRKYFGQNSQWAFQFGGGWGLTEGYGNPNFRTIIGLSYVRPAPTQQIKPQREKIEISERIHFAFDKAVIRPRSYPVLDHVAAVMKQDQGILLVEVEGHTDAIGSDVYNKRLSERRSQAVVAYLVQKNISRDRLQPLGFGEERPIADNNSAEGRAMNRRTEFIVAKRR